MSLYHSYDSQYRKLQESWRQVQEDEYQDALRSRGTKLFPTEDEYTERPGLEGPFRMHNGKTYYYDPKEGKYYDPTTDWYVDSDSEEFYQLTGMKKIGESLEEVETANSRVSQAHDLALKSIQLMKNAEKAYDSLGSRYAKYQMEASEVLYAMQALEDLLRDEETYSRIYEEAVGNHGQEA